MTDRTIGRDNGHLLGLIAERRMSRRQLNEGRSKGLYQDIHRPLIEDAFRGMGL